MRHAPILITAVALLSMGLSYPVSGEEPVTIFQLGRELQAIEILVENAQIKLKSGVSRGPNSAEGPFPRSDTAAESCCSANIRSIYYKIQNATAMVEQLTVRYSKESDRTASDLLEQLRQILIVVQQRTLAFERAGSVGRTLEALAGLTGPIIRMRSATRSLVACCSPHSKVLEPVETSQGKKKSRG